MLGRSGSSRLEPKNPSPLTGRPPPGCCSSGIAAPSVAVCLVASCGGGLLVELGFLLRDLDPAESFFDAFGQVRAGAALDAGDVKIYLPIFSNGDFDFLHKCRVIRVFSMGVRISGSCLPIR